MQAASVCAGSARQSDFRVYSAERPIAGASFYFVESTAPDTVGERVDPGGATPQGLVPVDPDQAVREIAESLTPEGEPEVDANLVVMSHGFNTPRASALAFYAKALAALEADQAKLFGQANRRTVCVAYRWPSERIGSVLDSSFSALPTLPLFLLAGSVLFAALCVWLVQAVLKLVTAAQASELARSLILSLLAVCGLLIVIVAILALLRAIVYFRDVYRATNYGVPDLVEVIRQIDREASDQSRCCGARAKASASASRSRSSAIAWVD